MAPLPDGPGETIDIPEGIGRLRDPLLERQRHARVEGQVGRFGGFELPAAP